MINMDAHPRKNEKRPPENKGLFFRRLPPVSCLIIPAVSNPAEEGKQIDAADTHYHIYDT